MTDKSKKNLIFCAYAHGDSFSTGANISKRDSAKHIYLKNAVVALVSAKKANPNCDVALVTNIDVPNPYRAIFDKESIMIFNHAFDMFNFGENKKWGLAFYKLCALQKMLDEKYSNYAMIDTDVFINGTFDDMWRDTEYYILLHDNGMKLSSSHCALFQEEVLEFDGIKQPLTPYCGGLVSGNLENLTIFMKECENIFHKMIEKNFTTTYGDEFILRIAAERLKIMIKNASAYHYPYWTGSFHLVTTAHIFIPICVLHVPVSKERGMIKLFNYYSRKHRLPSDKRVYKILKLPSIPFRVKLRSFIKKILKKD